jgi:hypothetical protein
VQLVDKNITLSELSDRAGSEDWIEFDSMINIRPLDSNRSRYIDDVKIRERIVAIVNKLVTK